MADENAELVFTRNDLLIASGILRQRPLGNVSYGKETGNLLRDTRNYGPPIRRNIGLVEEGVLRMFDENPGTSVRRAARALGLP